MQVAQNHASNVHIEGDPTVELPRVWSPMLVEVRSATVDEGAYQYVPRKLTATEGLEVNNTGLLPTVELASAPRKFPSQTMPTDPDAICLREVTKSSITIMVNGLALKLRREEARIVVSLLDAAL